MVMKIVISYLGFYSYINTSSTSNTINGMESQPYMVDVEEQSLLVLAHQASKIDFPFLKCFSFSGMDFQ